MATLPTGVGLFAESLEWSRFFCQLLKCPLSDEGLSYLFGGEQAKAIFRPQLHSSVLLE